MNTTSSPAPQRPVAALPSRPAKPLPVYVRVEHPAAVDRRPPDALADRPSSPRRSRGRASGRRSRRRRRAPRPPSRSAPACRAASSLTSGTPSTTPLATPIASTGGTSSSPTARSRARPATSPAWVPPLDDVCTIAAGVMRRRRHCSIELEVGDEVAERAGRRAAADRDRVRRGARRRSARRSAARERSPARPSGSAGSRRSAAGRRTARPAAGCPVGRAGRSPDSTRCTSSPSTAPAAAVMRQWLDCPAPTVTSERAPARSASPHRNSSLRALLPPAPRPVRSSRLTHSRAPPGRPGPALERRRQRRQPRPRDVVQRGQHVHRRTGSLRGHGLRLYAEAASARPRDVGGRRDGRPRLPCHPATVR